MVSATYFGLCLLTIVTVVSSQYASESSETPVSDRRTFKHGKPKFLPLIKKHKKFLVPFGKTQYTEVPVIHEAPKPLYKFHRYQGIEVKPVSDVSFSTPEPETHSVETPDFPHGFDHSYSVPSSNVVFYPQDKVVLPPPPKPVFSFVPAPPQPVFSSIPLARPVSFQVLPPIVFTPVAAPLPSLPTKIQPPVLPQLPVPSPTPIFSSVAVKIPTPVLPSPTPLPSFPLHPPVFSTVAPPQFPSFSPFSFSALPPPAPSPVPSFPTVHPPPEHDYHFSSHGGYKDLSLTDVEVKDSAPTIEPLKIEEVTPTIVESDHKNLDSGILQKLKGWKADKANMALSHLNQLKLKPFAHHSLSFPLPTNKLPLELSTPQPPLLQSVPFQGPLPQAPVFFPPSPQFFSPAKYEPFPPNNIESPLVNSYGVPVPHDTYGPPHSSHDRLSSASSEEHPSVVPAPLNDQNSEIQQDFQTHFQQPQDHPIYVPDDSKTANYTENKQTEETQPEVENYNPPNHKEQ